MACSSSWQDTYDICDDNIVDGIPLERELLDIEDMKPRKPLNYTPLTAEEEIYLVDSLLKYSIENKDDIKKFIRSISKELKKTVTPLSLIYTYRYICQKYPEKYILDNDLLSLMQTNEMRQNSGVMVVTLFTSPYPRTKEEDYGDEISASASASASAPAPASSGKAKWTKEFSCKHNCYYCPAFPDNPRSYDPKEPGNARAQRMEYNVTLQIWDRLDAYRLSKLETSKCEVLVLGGTWESYPKDYREQFIRLIYYSFNVYLDPERESNPRPIGTLEEELLINETTPCNVIGLTLETRPDCIGITQLRDFRRWGVTRIQLGIQSFDDAVLERVNRGTNNKQACRAVKLLLDCGFKIDIHIMLDLVKPFKKEFIVKMKIAIRQRVKLLDPDDPDFRKQREAIVYDEEDKATIDDLDDVPMIERDEDTLINLCFPVEENQPYGDQLKLYPTTVLEWTRVIEIWKKGLHKSYADEITYTNADVEAYFKKPFSEISDKEKRKYHALHNQLFKLILKYYPKIPYYMRCNRIPRDIPATSIVAGNRDTNMRQYFNDHFKKNGIHVMEMRYSEIKNKSIDPSLAEIHIFRYRNNGGVDYSIQFRTADLKYLFGFLRLRFPDIDNHAGLKVFPELEGCGEVRELHVYGAVTKVGKEGTKTQHLGFGTRLLAVAEFIALSKDYHKLSVIPGNGVKVYYRKKGYHDIGSFLIKTIGELPLEMVEPKITFHHLSFPKRGTRIDDVEVIHF